MSLAWNKWNVTYWYVLSSYRCGMNRSMMLIKCHDSRIPREIQDLWIGDDVLQDQFGGVGMDERFIMDIDNAT